MIKNEIRAQAKPWAHGPGIEILIRCYKDNIPYALQRLVDFMEQKLLPAQWYREDITAIPEMTLSLRQEAVQMLMDDLWNCGIRPTEGSGSAGSLKATENHLEDMKKDSF